MNKFMQNSNTIILFPIFGQSLALAHNGQVTVDNPLGTAINTDAFAANSILSFTRGIEYGGDISGGMNPQQVYPIVPLTPSDLGNLVDAKAQSCPTIQNNHETVGVTSSIFLMKATKESMKIVNWACGMGGTDIRGFYNPDTANTAEFDLFKTTLSDLNSDLSLVHNRVAIVRGDSTPGNNGIYIKYGASGTGSYLKSCAWVNLVSTLTHAVDRVAVQSLGTPKVLYLPWVQGESNLADSESLYTSRRTTLFNMINTVVQSITGQTENVTFFVGQVAALLSNSISGPQQAALSGSINLSNVVSWGPQYPCFPYSDFAHLCLDGYNRLGSLIGRAIFYWETLGIKLDLYVSGFDKIDEKTVDVIFTGPFDYFGGLSLDPRISDPKGFYGSEFIPSTGNAKINSVEIIGYNKVRYQFSESPVGDLRFAWTGTGIPGPTSGARSPLCIPTQDYCPVTGWNMPIYLSSSKVSIS
jgi:hypothetical protein